MVAVLFGAIACYPPRPTANHVIKRMRRYKIVAQPTRSTPRIAKSIHKKSYAVGKTVRKRAGPSSDLTWVLMFCQVSGG